MTIYVEKWQHVWYNMLLFIAKLQNFLITPVLLFPIGKKEIWQNLSPPTDCHKKDHRWQCPLKHYQIFAELFNILQISTKKLPKYNAFIKI